MTEQENRMKYLGPGLQRSHQKGAKCFKYLLMTLIDLDRSNAKKNS